MGEAKRRKQNSLYPESTIKPHKDAMGRESTEIVTDAYDITSIKEIYGYDKSHHLRVEKVVPSSLVRLRQLLAQPEHKDVADYARRGSTFEECLGYLAAALGIALDGEYDVPDLCELLYKALKAKRNAHSNITHIDSRLIPAELVEREGTISLSRVDDPDDFAPDETTTVMEQTHKGVVSNNRFMKEHNCKMCDHILLCVEANKCLGNSIDVLDEAMTRQERLDKLN